MAMDMTPVGGFWVWRPLRLALAVATLASALGACATVHVRADSDAAASLVACHSYAWVDSAQGAPGRVGAFGNPINDKRLRLAIGKRLAAHGWTEAAAGTSADCLIGYAVGSRIAFADTGPQMGFGGGWGRAGAGAVMAVPGGTMTCRIPIVRVEWPSMCSAVRPATRSGTPMRTSTSRN